MPPTIPCPYPQSPMPRSGGEIQDRIHTEERDQFAQLCGCVDKAHCAPLDAGAALQFKQQRGPRAVALRDRRQRSEEHTSELQSLMRISYAVFCLKNKN